MSIDYANWKDKVFKRTKKSLEWGKGSKVYLYNAAIGLEIPDNDEEQSGFTFNSKDLPVMLTIERLNPASTFSLPQKKLPTDGAYDLFCPTKVDIYPGERVTLDLQIVVGIPMGYMGILHGKSGWGSNNGLQVLAGLIDATYTGPLKVVLLNTSENLINVEAGAPIVQIYFLSVLNTVFFEVEHTPEGPRGNSGFNSGHK